VKFITDPEFAHIKYRSEEAVKEELRRVYDPFRKAMDKLRFEVTEKNDFLPFLLPSATHVLPLVPYPTLKTI